MSIEFTTLATLAAFVGVLIGMAVGVWIGADDRAYLEAKLRGYCRATGGHREVSIPGYGSVCGRCGGRPGDPEIAP